MVIVVEPIGEVSEDLLAEASSAPDCSLLSEGVQEVDLQELWLSFLRWKKAANTMKHLQNKNQSLLANVF